MRGRSRDKTLHAPTQHRLCGMTWRDTQYDNDGRELTGTQFIHECGTRNDGETYNHEYHSCGRGHNCGGALLWTPGLMSEQIIAAELHRSTNGKVDRIVFNGETYVRRNTVPPPNLNLAGYVGDGDDDYQSELTANVDAVVAHSRAVAPLPPELLLPDPDLMASPEGDVKGLRELQDAAREASRGPV